MTATYAIGIDIGGTKIAGGIVDLADGKILSRKQTHTNRSGAGSAALAAVADLASQLSAEAMRQGLAVAGIGVGAPELVDKNGVIRSSYNFEWEGLSLSEHLAAAVPAGIKIAVESDVRAAARAEVHYGAGRDRKICVYVNVGSGISYCLCIEGRPFPGANGYAIHFASSPLSMRCAECGAAQGPVVEEIASGPGIAHSYAAATMTPPAGAEPVLAAADAGDPKALAIIGDAAQLLGAALGLTVNMLDPEALVIGGGLGSADGLYWRSIVAETRVHIFAADRRDMPILRAALGPDAGIIGAALSSA